MARVGGYSDAARLPISTTVPMAVVSEAFAACVSDPALSAKVSLFHAGYNVTWTDSAGATKAVIENSAPQMRGGTAVFAINKVWAASDVRGGFAARLICAAIKMARLYSHHPNASLTLRAGGAYGEKAGTSIWAHHGFDFLLDSDRTLVGTRLRTFLDNACEAGTLRVSAARLEEIEADAALIHHAWDLSGLSIPEWPGLGRDFSTSDLRVSYAAQFRFNDLSFQGWDRLEDICRRKGIACPTRRPER